MFVCHRRDNSETAFQYLCGLVQSEKANMERMQEVVPGSEYAPYQHFISNSPWSAREVYDRVALEADRLLGGTGQTALIIDETAFVKKGRSSVAVARQWNGRLGHTENSQVAVFTALAAGQRVTPVDVALFVPEEWASDPERCAKAGIPEADRVHLTKPQLALQSVRHQREIGVRFDYVCADGLYGHSAEFARALDDDGEVFVLHSPANRRVYLEHPRPAVPPRKSRTGPAPTKLRAQCESVRLDELVAGLKPEDWQRTVVRKTTTGKLIVDIHRRPVWVWDGEGKPRNWQLVVRRDCTAAADKKHCLTNAPEDTDTVALARMEAQRFWIERSFEDAKGEAGMGDYQVRGWLAWHHHMALVMMAMLFMLRCRMFYKTEVPLLSCHDIRLLLAHFLPRANTTTEQIMEQLERRHRKRKAAIENSSHREEAAGVKVQK